jgi:hypothetical protein
VRIAGVAGADGDPRAGAGLRISKGDPGQKLIGTAPWTPYHYEFTVEEESSDVELICELRAVNGEALFELGSLKLERLP